MAGVVVPNMTLISAADATTDWSGSPTLDEEVYVEGTGSLSKKVSKTTSVHLYDLLSAGDGTHTDMSGGLIVGWMLGATPSQFDLKANGGIIMRVEAEVRWFTLSSAGYINCVASDVGKQVTDDGVQIGQLLSYDNGTNTWYVESATQIVSGSVMAIPTGTGAGTTNSVTTITTNNYGEWELAGSDQGYDGGWVPFAMHVDAAYDNIEASYTIGPHPEDIDYVGWSFTVTALGSKINCWWDVMYYGTGLTLEQGTSGAPATFDDFMTDASNGEDLKKFGIIEKKEGVYFIQGKIIIGDNVGTDNTFFEDESQILVFKDTAFPADFYELNFVGNGTGTTEIYMGTETGGRGISGFTVKDAGSVGVLLDVSDTNVDKFGVRGCIFQNLSTITLQVENIDKKVLSSTFENCAEILVSTLLVQYCQFINSPGRAVRLASTSHNVKDCSFVACTIGAHHSVVGTFGYDDMVFTGSVTGDIENSTNATLVDSYQPTEDGDVDVYSGSITRVAQQFTGTAGSLSRAIWSIRKQNSPTGNVVCKLYANSGGAPTGTALATSNTLDISTLLTSFADVSFEFEDEYTLVAATEYHIAIEYSGGDATNRLEVEYLAAGSGSETCNTYTGTWGSQTYDCRFQVNRDGIVKINASGTSNPGSDYFTGSPQGAVIIVNTVSLTVTCKNEAGLAVSDVNVRIETDVGVLITEGVTNASGIFTDNYNYEGSQAVSVIARKKGFKFNAASDTITGTFSVPFTMIRDKSVNLP